MILHILWAVISLVILYAQLGIFFLGCITFFEGEHNNRREALLWPYFVSLIVLIYVCAFLEWASNAFFRK